MGKVSGVGALLAFVAGCKSSSPPPDTANDALPAAPVVAAGVTFAKGDEKAVAAALKERGNEVGDDACFAWPESFPRVVVVGAFMHDRGCRNVGIFIDETWREVDGDVAGLASRGWEGASPSERRALARAWVVEVIQAFDAKFVAEKEPAFDVDTSPRWTPIAVREERGAIEIEGWVREPPGMRDEKAYERLVYRVDARGKVKVEHADAFSVPGPVLRELEKKSAK